MLETMLDAVSPIRRPRGRPGRPRKRPEKLHADKAYDFDRCPEALRQRGIVPRISLGAGSTQANAWDATGG